MWHSLPMTKRGNTSWGERVAERRKALDWSQAQLADLSQLSQSAISRIETGEAPVQDCHKVAIARVLGCPIEALFPYDEVAG